MNRGRRNLFLLAGIAGLAALGWFSRERPEPTRPLTALSQGAIEHIRVEHPGKPAIALARRDDGSWRMTEPVAADADAFEVASLLNLAALPVRRELGDDFDAAELGLSPPAFVITLNDVALRFGGTDPLSAQRVVQTDALAALVDNPPSAALDADFSDLVSKQLIPEGAEIKTIELPDGRVVQAANDGWRVIGSPELDPQALAEGWAGVRAMWNAAAPEAPEAPEVLDADGLEQVTVHLASGEALQFIVLQRAPQFELVNPELRVQYTLSAVLADTLLTVPEPEDGPEAAPEADAAD